MRTRKIILIKPRLGKRLASGTENPARLEPLALAILAALTPDDIELKVIDDRYETISYDQHADLVGLSVCTFSAKRAYEIAAEWRTRGVPVIMGGFHPTLCPDEALEHADMIATGEAEQTWPQVISDLYSGSFRKIYSRTVDAECRSVIPDRSVFKGKKYLPISMIQYSKGCPWRCEFCCIHKFHQGSVGYREMAEVIQEIESLPRLRRKLFFVDDNFLVNEERVKPFLEKLIPLKLRWSSQADMSFADNDELLSLVARSGCQSLTIGFESLNQTSLSQMGKTCNTVSLYTERLRKIRRAGIMVYGSFIFGYDADKPEIFEKTLEFAVREKLFMANFIPLQALPGTRAYERLTKEGRLVYDNWWLDPRYYWNEANVKPMNMTCEELTRGCQEARRKFHSYSSILSRFFERRANAGNLNNALSFLLVNYISRQEILRKTGMKLGVIDGSKG